MRAAIWRSGGLADRYSCVPIIPADALVIMPRLRKQTEVTMSTTRRKNMADPPESAAQHTTLRFPKKRDIGSVQTLMVPKQELRLSWRFGTVDPWFVEFFDHRLVQVQNETLPVRIQAQCAPREGKQPVVRAAILQ